MSSIVNGRYDSEWLKAYSTEDFEKKYTYEGNDLGASYSMECTTFKVWSPVAEKMVWNLYSEGDAAKDDKINSYEMKKGDKGIWEISVKGDIVNKYYTYEITFNNETKEFCDPYAKACGVNGNRAMVIALESTDPEGWSEDENPNANLPECDYIIYELHTRDFSADKSSDIKNKGKFLGLTEEGTTVNGKGKISSGLDHLKELGITHLHLLPFYDYATVDEAAAYDEKKYNWGYDPLNYNVPEGSFSTDPFDGSVRVRELKETVKKLHENGISVVMDVVYNHTYNEEFCFNIAVPGYFHRISPDGYLSNGSACGNDTASERSMVSKFIVDSVLYYAKEYHIDGFRFDLVGLLDVDTINKIIKGLDEIRPDILLYGEGWSLDTKLTKENVLLATQGNVGKIERFAMFSDNIRDAVKGSVFEEEERGFISGNSEERESLCKSIMGLPEWSGNPTDVINYTSCHDNYTLFDKIHLANDDISFEEAVKQNLLAISIIMLSQGIPLLHAGEEILRTKVDEEGNYVSDSVRSSDFVNSIKWSDLEKPEYYKVYEYYKGLIEFRKAHKALRMNTREEVLNNLSFMDNDNEKVIVYTLKEDDKDILIVFNSDKEAVNISLPEGEWESYIENDKAGNKKIAAYSGEILVAAISMVVLIKN